MVRKCAPNQSGTMFHTCFSHSLLCTNSLKFSSNKFEEKKEIMVTGCVTDAEIYVTSGTTRKSPTKFKRRALVVVHYQPDLPEKNKEGERFLGTSARRGVQNPTERTRGKRFPRLCVYRVMLHWRGKTLGLCSFEPRRGERTRC